MIRFIQSPNRTVRPDRHVSLVVLHYTASLSFTGTVSWFLNPASEVSAHYLVGRDGEIAQFVDEADIAWHAGKAAEWPAGTGGVNSRSIGIELVATATSGYTGPQVGALWTLLAGIVRRHQIAPENVVGHKDVLPAQKIDPDGLGHQFPWDVARAVAQAALTGTAVEVVGATGAVTGTVIGTGTGDTHDA